MAASDEAIRAGLQSGATALMTAAGDALAGPGVGILAGAVSDSVLTWFGAQASANDDALREARLGALEDEMYRLAERLRKLEALTVLDRADAISREQTFSEFARDVAAAHTPEKREALVIAAANRHNPGLGSAAMREYWYEVVRGLPDVQIALIRLLEGRFYVAIALEPEPRVSASMKLGHDETLSIPPADAAALWSAALAAEEAPRGGLVVHQTGPGVPGFQFKLTPHGKIVASFIKD